MIFLQVVCGPGMGSRGGSALARISRAGNGGGLRCRNRGPVLGFVSGRCCVAFQGREGSTTGMIPKMTVGQAHTVDGQSPAPIGIEVTL